MITQTAPADVRLEWIARREIALIDLREEDPFAKDHPLFAAQLPLSRLEVEILDRVPRKATKIVLYDDGEGLFRRPRSGCTRSATPTSPPWPAGSKAGGAAAMSCSRT